MPATRRKIAHKHFRLDARKIRRARKALNATTETETIERALDLVIEEAERNRIAREAHERFLRSGVKIKDWFAEPAT